MLGKNENNPISNNVIDPSISAISNHNEANITNSSFVGGSLLQEHRPKDGRTNLRIKINRPKLEGSFDLTGDNIKFHHHNHEQHTQHIDIDDINLNEEYLEKIEPEQIPLTEGITGYEICKESFSEEEIVEAFNVIDINKDKVITEEDVIFFLEYIKEPYTMEEVREMIAMVSTDNKKVTFEDFKKIGKGFFVPFADIKIPDATNKKKHTIYRNIKRRPDLYEESPQTMISAVKSDIVSAEKFEESKKAPKHQEIDQGARITPEQDELEFLKGHIILRSLEQISQMKEYFKSVQTLNVEVIVNNYMEIRKKYVNYKQIAKFLLISEKDAKQLYGDRDVLAKKVAMEAVAFSQVNKVKKLQYCLSLFTKKKTVNVNQLYHLLQFLTRKDQNGSLLKRLLTILKSKNISKDQKMDKFYALEIIISNSFNLSL